VAAASTGLDINRLVRVIEELPVTHYDLRVVAPELGELRSSFGMILATQPDAERLISSLVAESTLRMLELAPPESLPLASVALLQESFLTWARNEPLRKVESWLRHPLVTADAIDILLQRHNRAPEQDWAFLSTIAQCKNVSPAVLTRLAGHDDWDVRGAVAANPATPPEILRGLAGDPHPHVVHDLAFNPGVPNDVLLRLAEERNGLVLWGIAGNPATPGSILVRLSSNPGCRQAILQNTSAPPDVLRRLFDQTRVTMSLDQSGSSWDQIAAAGNPATPGDILTALSLGEGEAASFVARNTATPATTLIRLATTSSDFRVLGALVANPSLPAGDLQAGWWNKTLGLVAPEAALAAASRVDLPAGVNGVEHYALSSVRESVHALEKGAEVVTARRWSELPNRLDEPFELPARLVSAIEGQRLCGLQAQVARNGRALDELHDTMGNCLDQYIEPARSGKIIVAFYVDKERNDIYASAWNRAADGTLALAQMNSRFNLGQLPPGFREAEASLRASINESILAADGPVAQQSSLGLGI